MLVIVLTILRHTTLTGPCTTVVLITTLLGILLIPLLLSSVGSRAYRCTNHGTTCHTDERTYMTATPSAGDASDSRTDDGAEATTSNGA